MNFTCCSSGLLGTRLRKNGMRWAQVACIEAAASSVTMVKKASSFSFENWDLCSCPASTQGLGVQPCSGMPAEDES